MTENYVYKKEVDWSLLMEGLTLPVDNQVVFGQIMGRFLERGERKQIKVYLDGKSYSAVIYNINFDSKHHRKKDTYQIRYKKNGDLSQALQRCFMDSFQYLRNLRNIRELGDRSMLRLPDNDKEYLAI